MTPTCFWKKLQIYHLNWQKNRLSASKNIMSSFNILCRYFKDNQVGDYIPQSAISVFFSFLTKTIFNYFKRASLFNPPKSGRDLEISYAQSKPWQTIQIQNPRIHNPKPKLQNPKSKSKIQESKTPLQTPKSKLKNPKSNLKSTGAKKNKLIQNPRSKMIFFFPCCTHHDDTNSQR